MQVGPGVIAINSLGAGRAYRCGEADQVTLIDAGLRGSAARIARAARAVGHHPRDIRRIVITHYHTDHTGNIATNARHTDTEVLVHTLDAPVVRGEQPPPGLSSGGPLRALLARLGQSVGPVPVSENHEDDDEIPCLGGLDVLHPPAHTAGSISPYGPARRLLFAGDAPLNLFGVRLPFGIVPADMAQARCSIVRLSGHGIDTVHWKYARTVVGGIGEWFRRLAARLAADEARSTL